MAKKQGKGSKVTRKDAGTKPMGEASYGLDGDRVTWDGPAFLSWHDVANELDARQCLAVILAAAVCPFPLGDGQIHLSIGLDAAKRAIDTNGGRQLSIDGEETNGPMKRVEIAACDALNRIDKSAASNGVSRLGALRLYLAQKSLDRCNAPMDSYMRLALGTLDSY